MDTNRSIAKNFCLDYIAYNVIAAIIERHTVGNLFERIFANDVIIIIIINYISISYISLLSEHVRILSCDMYINEQAKALALLTDYIST